MPVLSIDIETTSLVDLPKCGVYPYAQHKSFDVLCIAYAVDNEPIRVIPTHRAELRGDGSFVHLEHFLEVFTNPSYTKTAFNVQFEYVCLREFLRDYTSNYPGLNEWRCTQAAAMVCGLPSTLDGVAVALGINHRKHADGWSLMKRFSIPDKRTGTVESPLSDPEAFSKYMDYCAQDVEVERAVRRELRYRGYTQPPLERKVWLTNMAICDKGMRVDTELCEQVILLGAEYTGSLLREAQTLGVANARSPKQVKDWLNAALDESESDAETEPIISLSAGHIDGLKATFADDKDALRLLTIRQELAKSSLSKFVTFLCYADREARAKGTIRYCGAQQTGRFAGAGPQPHNLTKNVLKTAELQELRQWVKAGDVKAIRAKYNGLLSLPLSQLVRAAIIPEPGKVLVLADFAAIESRVLAWLAGERWKLDVFSTTGKIYEEVAARMYGLKAADIGKDSPYRDNGKRAELSLGFGGGVGALESSSRPPIAESIRKYRLSGVLPGALAGQRYVSAEKAIESLFTTSLEQRQDTVNRWRQACPSTVRFWAALEGAAKRVIASKRMESVGKLNLYMVGDELVIQLPSGRALHYHKARLAPGKFEGSISVKYMSVLGNTGKWFADETYGGKLTENVVQAVASDLLREALVRLWEQGEVPVLDVHDEIVLEVPNTPSSIEYTRELLKEAMTRAPKWAEGLPLAVETEVQDFYHK